MSQKMSWEEMKKVYPDEWVAIIHPEGDLERPFGNIIGEVLCHNSDERLFTKELKEKATYQVIDMRFTGEILPDYPVGPILWQIFNTNS